MSYGKLLCVLVAIVALGVGTIVVQTEFVGKTSAMDRERTAIVVPNNSISRQQQQAEQKSEQQAIRADCAALRKMGATMNACTHQ